MALLNFTLTPESLGKLHDALACLGKFSEAVCIEAVHDKVKKKPALLFMSLLICMKLVLTALNSSKSAYASFTLVGSKFFSRYHFKGSGEAGARGKFNCKIYNKVAFSCSWVEISRSR